MKKKSKKIHKKQHVAHANIFEDIGHNTSKVHHDSQSHMKNMGRQKHVRRNQSSGDGLPKWRSK